MLCIETFRAGEWIMSYPLIIQTMGQAVYVQQCREYDDGIPARVVVSHW